jgi:hypothetical protein
VSKSVIVLIKIVLKRRYFAKQAVELGVSAGDLAILSEEAVVAYERPALSKAYLNPKGSSLHLTVSQTAGIVA